MQLRPLRSDEALHDVEAMIANAESFKAIEDHIEEMDISDSLKSALWLMAWAETNTDQRREVVRSMVEAAST